MSQPPPPLPIDWTEQRAFLGRSLYVWQVNLASLLAVLFVAFVGFYFSSPFLPLLVRHLGVTDPRAVALWSGVLIGLGPASAVIASPLWGRLADRIGGRVLLVRTVFGFALLNGLCAVATTGLVDLRIADPQVRCRRLHKIAGEPRHREAAGQSLVDRRLAQDLCEHEAGCRIAPGRAAGKRCHHDVDLRRDLADRQESEREADGELDVRVLCRLVAPSEKHDYLASGSGEVDTVFGTVVDSQLRHPLPTGFTSPGFPPASRSRAPRYASVAGVASIVSGTRRWRSPERGHAGA